MQSHNITLGNTKLMFSTRNTFQTNIEPAEQLSFNVNPRIISPVDIQNDMTIKIGREDLMIHDNIKIFSGRSKQMESKCMQVTHLPTTTGQIKKNISTSCFSYDLEIFSTYKNSETEVYPVRVQKILNRDDSNLRFYVTNTIEVGHLIIESTLSISNLTIKEKREKMSATQALEKKLKSQMDTDVTPKKPVGPSLNKLAEVQEKREAYEEIKRPVHNTRTPRQDSYLPGIPEVNHETPDGQLNQNDCLDLDGDNISCVGSHTNDISQKKKLGSIVKLNLRELTEVGSRLNPTIEPSTNHGPTVSRVDDDQKGDKKNVNKNIIKSFRNFLKNNQNWNVLAETLDKLPEDIQKLSKEFQDLEDKSKYNNSFIKTILSLDSKYREAFGYYLKNAAFEWLKSSGVVDKETHQEILIKFAQYYNDPELMNKQYVHLPPNQ